MGCDTTKRFSAVCSGKEIEVELNENDSDSIAVYGSGGVFKFTNSYLYDKPSVLFGRKGTIGKPIYLDKKFWTVDTMYFVKFNDKIVPKFCYYYLTFYPGDIIMTHTALPSIVGVGVEISFFAFPSITEQKQIADYLDNKCSYIK